jgi:hypothetical protein
MSSEPISYQQGFVDGRRHAQHGRPPLSSPSPYGQGFYDGWKSVRYPDEPTRDETRAEPGAPLTRTA